MTREAVQAGFERFLDDAIVATAGEFSISRALQGSAGPGGAAVDKLVENSETVHEQVVAPELAAYRSQMLAQFDVILDYAASGEGIDDYRDEILAADAFVDSLRSDLATDQHEAVCEQLLDRHRRLGDAVTPLVESSKTAFWRAARAELDETQVGDLVETHFAFTAPIRENRAAFRMETTVDLADIVGSVARLLGPASRLDVEFTDEALRAMRRAEKQIITETKAEATEQFESEE